MSAWLKVDNEELSVHHSLLTCFCLGAVSSGLVAFLMLSLSSFSAFSLSTGRVGRCIDSSNRGLYRMCQQVSYRGKRCQHRLIFLHRYHSHGCRMSMPPVATLLSPLWNLHACDLAAEEEGLVDSCFDYPNKRIQVVWNMGK